MCMPPLPLSLFLSSSRACARSLSTHTPPLQVLNTSGRLIGAPRHRTVPATVIIKKIKTKNITEGSLAHGIISFAHGIISFAHHIRHIISVSRRLPHADVYGACACACLCWYACVYVCMHVFVSVCMYLCVGCVSDVCA